MMRGTLLCAVALAVVAGCGRSLPPTPVERGAALVKSGQYDDAIAALAEAIRLEPRDPQAYLLRGRAYQCRNHSGDLDAAIADFTAAIGLAPKDPEAYYSRAIALRDRGDAARDDAGKAAKDDEAARRLDGRLEAEYRQLGPIAAPPAVDPRPITVASPSGEAEKAAESAKDESSSEMLRRLEAQAAAAARDEGRPGRGEKSATRSRLYPPDSAGDAKGRARGTPAEHSAKDAKRVLGLGDGDDAEVDPSQADARRPVVDPNTIAPPLSALDPQAAGGADLRAPLDPRAANAVPSTGIPLQAPLTSPYATSPYQPAAPAPAPYLSPYPLQPPSPFPQRAPRPTGYVEQQIPGALRTQPRPYYTPSPIRPNQLPSVRYGDYNP
jgi:hypothetical protein